MVPGTTYVVDPTTGAVTESGDPVGGVISVTFGALDKVTIGRDSIYGIDYLLVGADGEPNRVIRKKRFASGVAVPEQTETLTLTQHAAEYLAGDYIVPGSSPGGGPL